MRHSSAACVEEYGTEKITGIQRGEDYRIRDPSAREVIESISEKDFVYPTRFFASWWSSRKYTLYIVYTVYPTNSTHTVIDIIIKCSAYDNYGIQL